MDGLLGGNQLGTLGLLGLSPEEINRARGQAQSDMYFALASQLLGGGPTGASLAKGLQMGQQAYRNALSQQAEERMQQVKIQEYLRQQQEAQAAKQRQARVEQIIGGAYQPAVAGAPAREIYGEDIMGQRVGEGMTPAIAARPASFDLRSATPLLMATPEGRKALTDVTQIMPALRKAGLSEQPQTDNPFAPFISDQTVPQNIRTLASQYAKSYQSGILDPEKADERLRQLGEMTQRAQQFQQTQASLQEQRAATNAIAQGNQQIQRMMAEAKLEEKRAKAEEKATTKSEAKDQLTATVEQLKGKYDTLLKEGGIVSTQAGGLQNIGARLSSSGLGRAVGGAVGTKTQEQRQAIEQTRPLLLNLIKNATGMSAQQMNSNAEMQLYLNAATNPDLSYEANMEALKNLDRLFGLGTAADKIEKSVVTPKAPGQSRSGW